MTTDTITEAVREKLAQRAAAGKAKYGVTMERQDLTRLQWLVHAQEEALDLAVYLQKLIVAESVTTPFTPPHQTDRIEP